MRSKTTRALAVFCLALILIMSSATFAFGAGLEMVSSFPEDGNNTLERMNLMVKLNFNQDMSSEKARAINANKFTVQSEDGTENPEFEILYDPDDSNKISLMMTQDLSVHTNYVATISADLQSSNGEVLGKELKISFGTRDEKRDNTVYMGLMVVLVIGMVFFTQHEQKKKDEKEAVVKGDKVNPYKMAKEKGISVEKAVESTDKQRDKVAKKTGQQGSGKVSNEKYRAGGNRTAGVNVEEDDSDTIRKNVKHVHTKRTTKQTFKQKKQKQEQEKKQQQKQKQAQKNKKKK